MDSSSYSAEDCNFTNYDESYSYPYSYDFSPSAGEKAKQSLLIISLLIVNIAGVVGNSLVILSLCIGTRKLGITSILLGSLAVSDLMINIWYVPMEMKHIIHPPWQFGSFLCIFMGFLGVFAQSSSACMLLIISCERFLVILYPLTSRTMLTRRRTFMLVQIAWVVSTALAALPASFKRVQPHVPCSVTMVCTNSFNESQRVFFYFYALLILYLLPLGGMGIANTCVMRALIKSSAYTKKLQSMKSLEKGVKYSTGSSRSGNGVVTEQPIYKDGISSSKSEGQTMTNSETDEDPFPPVTKVRKTKAKKNHTSVAQRQRVVVMLLAVVLLYAICWLPHFIIGMLIVIFKVPPHHRGMIVFEGLAKICYSANSALNPVVYGFMSKNFRQRIVHGLSRLKFWSRKRGRSNSLGSAYTLSTRGSAMSQSTRATRYSVLPRA